MDQEIIYEIRRLARPLNADTFVSQLEYMKEHGSSVTLNWGEGDDLWECSWITAGNRFSGYSGGMRMSVVRCLENVLKGIEAED